MIRSILSHRGFQIIFLVTCYLFAASALPKEMHSFLYTMGRTVQEMVLWMIPVIICIFIAHTISSFKKSAVFFLVFLLFLEAISNFASVSYAYLCSFSVRTIFPPLIFSTQTIELPLLWPCSFSRPCWYTSQNGVFLGAFIGLMQGFFPSRLVMEGILRGKFFAEFLLKKVLSPLIPLLILGCVAKIYFTHCLEQIYGQCATITVFLILFSCAYVALLFFVGNINAWKNGCTDIYNLLPAAMVAFTSGSGLASMPWTISGTSKNLTDPEFAQMVIPATTNIQQIGDCFINAFLCCVLHVQFFGFFPPATTWLSFSIIFVLARYTTAAITGGAIFIMLPIYEKYLSFTPEMLAIILAFNVVLDPIVTCLNVLSNGALCKIYEKLWRKISSPAHFLQRS